MTITINGTDITSYIKHGGLNWSLNSIDAEGAGRNLNGEMQRKLVATKQKLEIACVPLNTTQVNTLLTLLSSEWLTVVITPTGETAITKTMYAGSTIKRAMYAPQGTTSDLWTDMAFSLIEK